MNLFDKWQNRVSNIKDYGILDGMAMSAIDELDDFDRKIEEVFEQVDRLIENPPNLFSYPNHDSVFCDYVTKQLEPGDIIAVSRDWPVPYLHFAVYVGNQSVIHFASPNGDFGEDITVHEAPFSEFLRDGKSYYILNFGEKRGQMEYYHGEKMGVLCLPLGKEVKERIRDAQYHLYSPQETVERARMVAREYKTKDALERFFLGMGYNVFSNNCEHFALWCKTGVHESRQVENCMHFDYFILTP